MISLVAVPNQGSATIDESSCLLVSAGGERFGILASRVIRLLRDVTIHPIPGARAPLVGLGQYGGVPVAVVDLPELVGRTASGASHQVIVLIAAGRHVGREMIGLAVDEADRLTVLDEIESSEEAMPPLVGWIERDGQRIWVVDPSLIADEDVSGGRSSGAGERP